MSKTKLIVITGGEVINYSPAPITKMGNIGREIDHHTLQVMRQRAVKANVARLIAPVIRRLPIENSHQLDR